MIAFTPHVTNGDNPTLNVDGLGARGLYGSPSTPLLAGTLIQGTPYVAIYNGTDGRFYLHGYYSSPYNVPILGGMDYWDVIAPNSSFIFPFGQAISRTTYAYAFSRWGTTFGAGDGSTTFNVPDLRGRVTVPPDNMGGAQAFRINNILQNPMGSVGGEQQHALTVNEGPPHFHGVSLSDPGHSHGINTNTPNVGVTAAQSGGPVFGLTGSLATVSSSGTGISISSPNGANTTFTNGGGAAHNNVQPSIIAPYVIRII